MLSFKYRKAVFSNCFQNSDSDWYVFSVSGFPLITEKSELFFLVLNSCFRSNENGEWRRTALGVGYRRKLDETVTPVFICFLWSIKIEIRYLKKLDSIVRRNIADSYVRTCSKWNPSK